MNKSIIQTPGAPAAIGTYSQAVRVDHTVYLSGQIGLDPASMQMVDGIETQIHQVFKNLAAVATAAGGSLADVVKLNVFLTDLGHFPKVNEIMAQYFAEPYPARAAVGVAALPRGALVEADLAGQVDGVVDPHGLRVGSDRGRRVGGLDDVFVHAGFLMPVYWV